uniref:Uncharacterized protein n=1 Tax=Thermofilum pendens TaxID=2269 RepID=A0A7J3X5K2_THEPE
MTYHEPLVEVGSVEEALSALERASPLVVRLAGAYYPLHLLHRSLGRRPPKGAVRVLSSMPGFRRALSMVSSGVYVVARGRVVTPRSILRHAVEEGLLSPEAALVRMLRHAVPCLRCNASVKTVVRLMESRGAVAVPLCWRSRAVRVVTAVEVLRYALDRGLTLNQLLLDRTPASRLGGAEHLPSKDPLADLLERLYATVGERLLDVSSARMVLGELAGGV